RLAKTPRSSWAHRTAGRPRDGDGPHLRRTSCCYLLPGVDGCAPDWVPVLPAPCPEPTPPVPGTAPELPMLVLLPLDPGVVDVVPGEDEVPPALPLPVVMPSSFRHFSRSAAIMPRHLLLGLDAPLLPDTPGEPVPGVVELPVVPALLPVPPYVDPVPCASDTPESAKSAAAVAAQMS